MSPPHIVRACCALALLALGAAAQGGGHAPHGPHGPHPANPAACDPDDARCLALQRDVCDPWNVTAADK
jgi:hypothetical protein